MIDSHSERLIQVNALGLDFHHDTQFLIDRPSGSGDYLFLHFPTAVELRDVEGIRWRQPNSCILYAPGHPQWYRNNRDGFVNHWLHFSARIPPFRGLPVNRVLSPGYTHFILTYLNEIQDELLRKGRHWQEAADLGVQRFLLELARAVEPRKGRRVSKHGQAVYQKLLGLKMLVGREFRKKWSIEAMAALVPLSPSRFSALYKEFFRVSPVEDLLSVRIEKARWMLERMPYPVARIAEECGFENLAYFSRLFKQRTGCSPSRYCSLRQSGSHTRFPHGRTKIQPR